MLGSYRAAAVMAAALLVSGPLHAQEGILRTGTQVADIPEMDWTLDRPDGSAPAGVIESRLLEEGEFLLGYRLLFSNFEENLVGSDSIPVSTLLSSFATAPISRSEQRHTVELLYGVSDQLTVRLAAPLVHGTIDEVAEAGNGDLLVFGSDVTSIGDVTLSGLLSVVDAGAYQLMAGAGISAPLGKTDGLGQRASSSPGELVLPYHVQPGSGTWDIHPSVTFKAMNELASIGAQMRGVIRAGENDRGYTLGNQVGIQFWGARAFSDWISGSIGVNYRNWSNVEGVDEALAFDPEFSASPANNTLSQGGTRWDMPIGVNVMFRDGVLEGYRLSGEVSFPVSQDLDGPQLGQDMGITVSLSKLVGG